MKKKLIYSLSLLAVILFIMCTDFITEDVYAASYSIKINVTSKEYGAKKGTDSTKAIQKALDVAASKGTKKKPALVKIPKGTYYISAPLSIGSNTTLQLDKKTVIKKTGKQIPLYMLRTKLGTKGGYKDTENITVTGGCWDAEYKKYNQNWSGTQFFFVHTTNLRIKNVELKNNFGTHLIELGGVNKCTITGCKFHGFQMGPEGKIKEAIQLDVNHDDEMMSSAGVFDDTSCNNITIKNNEFYDYPRAIGSHLAVDGIFHQHIVIADNNMHDLSNSAIYGYNYQDCTITGNTIKNAVSGIVIRNNDTGGKGSYISRLSGIPATKINNNDYKINISDNTICLSKVNSLSVDSKENGDSIQKSKGIYIAGGDDKPMGNITIKGNEITADTVGIHLNDVFDINIADNRITRNASAYNAEATKYTEEGIMLENAKGNISNITILTDNKNPYNNGIGMNNSDISIDNYKISAVINKGISVISGSKLVLSNSDISGSTTDYGLFVSGSSKASVSNTAIYNNSKSGVYANASELNCSNCQIKNNTKSGFTLQDSKVELTGNDIIGNLQRSITVTGGCKGTISGNTFMSPDVSNELYLSGSNSFSSSLTQINKKTIQKNGGSYTDLLGNCFKCN